MPAPNEDGGPARSRPFREIVSRHDLLPGIGVQDQRRRPDGSLAGAPIEDAFFTAAGGLAVRTGLVLDLTRP